MRANRPYMPGMFFHLTARTQGKVHYFNSRSTRSRIVRFLARAIDESDAGVCAFVIMTNHMHIVARQGAFPLGRLMQSLLRRTSLLVQRRSKVTGHVFGGRYWHSACTSDQHLRAWIRYVHNNPVRASLCERPEQYRWSSHHWWAAPKPPLESPRLYVPRELFACADNEDAFQLCANYQSFMAHLRGDVERVLLRSDREPLVPPPTDFEFPRPRADLDRIISTGLKDIAPDLSLEDIRVMRGAGIRRLRRRLIERALLAGHTNRSVAVFLNVSEAAVSRIGRSVRPHV